MKTRSSSSYTLTSEGRALKMSITRLFQPELDILFASCSSVPHLKNPIPQWQGAVVEPGLCNGVRYSLWLTPRGAEHMQKCGGKKWESYSQVV